MTGYAAGSETDRLAVLGDYRVLDTLPEPGFDDCTAVAARVFRAPVALISLVDEARLFFKSRHGLDAVEVGRAGSLCEHAVATGRTVVVPDTHLDPRFAGSALVVGGPRIRFYAGAVLVARGHCLGTLCVIDQKPRRLRPENALPLEALARQVVAQLDLRRATRLPGGAIPVCAWCRDVRDDAGRWGRAADALARALGRRVTHGMCPDCFARHVPAG